MKLSLFKVAAALVVVGAMAGNARASIIGSAHDFGSFAWSGNQICQPCHTPHNATVKDANGVLLQGPIWNHTLSSATYSVYQINFDAVTGKGVVDPVSGTLVSNKVTRKVDQNSKLCLSCHDGTVALDSFGGNVGTQQISDPDRVFGTDLSNDHPIGDGALYPTTDGKTSSVPYMVDPSLRSAVGIMPLRVMDTGELAVGCTSCHEPHNRKNQTNLLWVNNSGPATTVDGRAVSGSALCTNCHKK